MIEELESISLLGHEITSRPVGELVDYLLNSNNAAVACFNAHSYVVQKTNKPFKIALLNSRFLIPDGSGIVLSLRLLNRVKLKKIAGYDFFVETMS